MSTVDIDQIMSVKNHIIILASSVSDIPEFKKMSDDAIELLDQLQSGQITVSEYVELKDDIVNLDKIRDTMTMIDIRQRLLEAANALINLLKVAVKLLG